MKGLISGIKRMEIHDGDGLRTTVFLKGCPLKCVWCHNPESISFQKQLAVFAQKCILCGQCKKICPRQAVGMWENHARVDYEKCIHCGQCAEHCPTGAMMLYGKKYEADELVGILLEDEAFFRNGAGGVTLSGGECLAQEEFAVEVAGKLSRRGISVDIDTCGFVRREAFERVLPYTDTFLYDIKGIDPKLHEKNTGQRNELILSNLQFLSEYGARIEIRYPLVKGFNDSESERVGSFLQDLKGIVKVKVLQCHSFAASRYAALGMVNTLPGTETTFSDVEHAISVLKRHGLNAVEG